jgi:hypothetical protein
MNRGGPPLKTSPLLSRISRPPRTVWRFEGAYFFHEATNTDFTTIDKVDNIKFMLGFDRPTWIKFLNPTRTFLVSGQWFHQTRFDWHKPEHSNDRNSDLLTLLLQGNYFNDRWTPQVLIAYDTNNNWWYAPGLTWNYSGNWKFGIEANVFSAPNKGIDTSFGPFRENSEVLLRIRYSFQ